MTPEALELEQMRDRMRKLEAKTGWLTLALLIVAGLVVAYAVAMTLTPRDPYLSARGFLVKDAGGRTRAVLGVGSGGNAGLTVTDEDARPRASLSLTADGSPSLTLIGRDGSRAVLGSMELRSQGEWPGERRLERRPAASLVLLSAERRVFWSAP